MSFASRIIKFFASLRLAVMIIVALAVIAAVGTITEARYNDSEVATRLVYQSPYMYAVLGILIVQLIAVMIDRWPWRQRHTGFVLAHIGIILLLGGAYVTQVSGVDGSMAFEIGEIRDLVQVRDRAVMVFATFDGGEMRPMHDRPVDFLTDPPSAGEPYVVQLGADPMRFTEHHQFAFRESEILPTDLKGDPPAIRFQLENANVNMTQWLRRERGGRAAELELGPAKVVFAAEMPRPSGRNEVILVSRPDSDLLDFAIYNKDGSLRKKGKVRQSETIETGWMGLKFRLLRYLPHAAETVRYIPAGYSTPMTTSAAKFEFRGKTYWVGLNSPLKLFLEDKAYVVVYGMRQVPLGFPLRLLEFRMDKYQGTDRAATYESDVEVPGRGKVTISMNEPLKHAGYTFYQSSYEMNERGEPMVSVLSVNRDPGRWLKYLGSLLIVLGAIILFWFKRVNWTHRRKPA